MKRQIQKMRLKMIKKVHPKTGRELSEVVFLMRCFRRYVKVSYETYGLNILTYISKLGSFAHYRHIKQKNQKSIQKVLT